MKKHFFFFAAMLMACAAISFTGCKDSGDEPEAQQEQIETVVWDADDLQQISINESKREFICKGMRLWVMKGTADGLAWKNGEQEGVSFNGTQTNGPSFIFSFNDEEAYQYIKRIEITAGSFIALPDDPIGNWEQTGNVYSYDVNHSIIGFFSATDVTKITFELVRW